MRIIIDPFSSNQNNLTTIDFTPEWRPLTDIGEATPDPAVYVLGTPFSISYPRKNSQILCIGSTPDMRAHLKQGMGEANLLLNRMLKDGLDISCAWLPLPDYGQEEILSVEFNTHVTFGKDYGLIAYGNETLPDAAPIDTTIRFKEKFLPEQSLTPEDLAHRFDLIYELPPYPVLVTGEPDTADSEGGISEIFSGNFHTRPVSS